MAIGLFLFVRRVHSAVAVAAAPAPALAAPPAPALAAAPTAPVAVAPAHPLAGTNLHGECSRDLLTKLLIF